MAGIEDDGSLAEDMVEVEVLLGHNVVSKVKDNLILDLLRTYSTDRNRVQRVANELQQTYLKDDNTSFMDDQDDDVLLALDSPFLPSSRFNLNDPTPIAQDGLVISKENHTSTSSGGVSSSGNTSPESEGVRDPVLQPAKFNVAADQLNQTIMSEKQATCSMSSSSHTSSASSAGSFVNHRNARSSRASDYSSSTSTDTDSEPEVISIHEERKRRKLCGNKSPGKKTKVEVVDLVTSSPSSTLDSKQYFDIVQAMFPDADPVYLRQRFKHIDDEVELNAVAAAMLEADNYPRIVAGGPSIPDQGSERPSTSTNHDVPVILKPSMFLVEEINEPQPSTSSTIPGIPGDREDQPNETDETNEPFFTPEVIAAISAIEDIIAPNSVSLPPPCGTPFDVPNSTAAVVQPHLSVNQVPAPGEEQVSSTPSSEYKFPTSSTSIQTVPSLPDHVGLVPQPHLQSGVTNPSTNSLPPPEASDISPLPEFLAPPSVIIEEAQPSASGTNYPDFRDVNEPGPSGTTKAYSKEEPWTEKYLLLLCLLPQSDPKYLETRAKQLYDNDAAFNFFVETSIEALDTAPPRPPLNDDRRGDGQVTPANVVQINLSVNSGESASGSMIASAQKNSSANPPGQSAANIPGPSSTITSGPSSTITSGPSSTITSRSSSRITSGPSSTITSGPSSTITSGSSNASAPGTSGAFHQHPGPSSANLPGPSDANLPGPSDANLPGPSVVDPAVPGSSGINNGDGDADPWSEKYSFLLSILPEADPTFLEEKAKLLYDKDEEMKTFVANALENKDYPTLKDYQRRQELVALQNKYLKDFNIENFLDIVPEPFKYFSQSTRKPSSDDQNRGLAFLKRKYRLIRSNDITTVYKKSNYNLTKTCQELNNFTGVPLKSRRSDFQTCDKVSDTNLSLQFLQELAFIENEEKIKKYLKDKEDEEARALKEAQDKGELLECNCCFDDEVLARNIVACPEGHIFCKSCLRKGAETKIGEGITKVSCLTDCQSEFTLQALQSVLKPTVFSKLAQRKQLEEIKAAGIEDLIQCPFCDFCNIPGAGDKVFRCLNPDCMKNSCILCKEESHIPLRCDEVEKTTEVKMRTYIEDKMTEALVRQCWKCQRKFVKIDGCNKMTCQCGALMCYICRQPVKDYSHFNGQGGEDFDKCPLFSDNNALHVDAVEKVAAEAKAELAQKHPGLTLRHDPTAVPIARDARVQHGAVRVLPRGYGNVGLNLAYGPPPRIHYPGAIPAAAAMPAAPMPAAMPVAVPAPLPQIPQQFVVRPRPQDRDYYRAAENAAAAVNLYRAHPAYPRHHNYHYQRPPPPPQRQRPRDPAMDLPELRDFAADVLADLQRDVGLAADLLRPGYPNNPGPNVNVPARNGNVYYAQDVRRRREYYEHRPN